MMHLKRALCLGLSVFVFSDGAVWCQRDRGVQKSGSYNTSSTNSRIRAGLAYIVAWRHGGSPAVIAMGDDAVERAVEGCEPIRAYDRLGFRLKEVSRDVLEFCAYRFSQDGFFPVRWHKMVANMLWTKPRDEQHALDLRTALRYELRHAPCELLIAERLITALRWGAENTNGKATGQTDGETPCQDPRPQVTQAACVHGHH